MFQHRSILLALALSLASQVVAATEIMRVWLSHKSNDPSRLVVNWESNQPGPAAVRYTAGDGAERIVEVDEKTTLHHVEIPLTNPHAPVRYRVATGDERSPEFTFRGYEAGELRVAVVADWQGKPNLDAILRDDVHLLLTAGDNIADLHRACGAAEPECTLPYSALVDAYPTLFSRVPFLPILGNHDREMRPRGPQPPQEPVYDVDATAFRKFFELPDDEWKWRFDLPQFGVRFIGLDLNHTSDFGTTWQTCHAFDRKSEQFAWYQKLMTGPQPKFVVTLQNERNASMRAREAGDWHDLFRRGTLTVTGFGYFAERAEVDGHAYYNTALGTGAKYPDPKSQFFAGTPSYLLLVVRQDRLTATLKDLDGNALDVKAFETK